MKNYLSFFIVVIMIILSCGCDKSINKSKENYTAGSDISKTTYDESVAKEDYLNKKATDYLPNTTEMRESLKEYFAGKGIDFDNWVQSGTGNSILKSPNGVGAIVVNNNALTFSIKAEKDVILYGPNGYGGETICYIRSWSYDVYEILEVLLSYIPAELRPTIYELKNSEGNISTGYSAKITKGGLQYKVGINNGQPVEIYVTI